METLKQPTLQELTDLLTGYKEQRTVQMNKAVHPENAELQSIILDTYNKLCDKLQSQIDNHGNIH